MKDYDRMMDSSQEFIAVNISEDSHHLVGQLVDINGDVAVGVCLDDCDSAEQAIDPHDLQTSRTPRVFVRRGKSRCHCPIFRQPPWRYVGGSSEDV